MAAIVMDGKALAAKVKERVRRQVEQLDIKPGLAVVLVGDDPASRVYVNGKKKDCGECGIYSEEYALPGETTQKELLELVAALNDREDIDGILVQLPLPSHLNEKEVLLAVRPDKDVDCFHPFNVGQLMIGEEGFKPCTPAGVMELLQEYGIDPAGKHCVIVGRVQYRREAPGHADGPKECHCHHLSHPDQESKRDVPPGRYFGSCRRTGRPDFRGYGEGGGRCHRRGHEPQ